MPMRGDPTDHVFCAGSKLRMSSTVRLWSHLLMRFRMLPFVVRWMVRFIFVRRTAQASRTGHAYFLYFKSTRVSYHQGDSGSLSSTR